MALCVPLRSAPLLLLSVIAVAPAARSQQTTDAPTIVQPGAPGETSRELTPETAGTPVHPPSAADISFMQGMIMHHSQAVEMTELLRTRSQDKDVHLLGDRISISQTDEMQYMKQWLQDRGQPIASGHDMHNMNMADMKDMPGMAGMGMMPGMLTPQQMEALRAATGPAFDHLFLTGMIQHHTGALTMVQDLFDTPGAGQDAVLFDFATDVDNTQSAEINIMQGLLLKEKK